MDLLSSNIAAEHGGRRGPVVLTLYAAVFMLGFMGSSGHIVLVG